MSPPADSAGSSLNIALIGCGKMGSALLRGWLASGIAKHVDVLDPGKMPDDLAADDRVTHAFGSGDLNNESWDIMVMAVKPQIMEDVCAALVPLVHEGLPILSIAAGKTTSSFLNIFSIGQPVVRAMPNTPAAIGQGITVACTSAQADASIKVMAEQLLLAVGDVLWLENEDLMNAVTAVSGSGPAYVFHLIEAMAKAGEEAGLAPDMAMKLARQTVIGSAALAKEDPAHAATLRENVTSPGGTTEAALKILMDGRFQGIMDEAVAAATKRGEELAD